MNFAEQRLFRSNPEWHRQRIKHHVEAIFGGGTPSTENPEFWTNGTIPWVSSKDMKVSRLSETNDYITEAAVAGSATNLVAPGSILMVVRSGILKHSIPVAINEVEVALNQDIKAFVLRETLDPDFFYFWVTGQQRDLLLEWGQLGATVDSLNIETLRNTVIPLPSRERQKAIVRRLHARTARIDGLIEKKARFIALLKEKRVAVIAHAVTKGLNRDAPMKDSGQGWLGEVPAHWEVVPSIWLFTESKERAHEDDDQLSATQKYGVIPLSEFERLEQRQVTKAFLNLEQRKHVEIGDFVISMRSMDGGLERAKARGCVRSSYVVLKSSSEIDVDFFTFLFKSISYIQALRATSSFIRDGQDLNFWNFRAVKLPRLPLDEQAEIARFLSNETAGIDTLITKTEQSIALLKEKRAALITAAVTGKIDVRNAA